MSGLLLALDAHIARLNAGVNEGFMDPINVPTLTITQPDPETIERVSYMRSSYGQALDSFARPQPTEVEIVTDETAPDILSMALLGTPADYAQAAGTDQTVNFTAQHDRWVALGANNLTAFTIAGSVEGDDYEVNMEAGLVKALSAGNITDSASTDATASYPAREGKSIVAGTDPVLQLAIRGEGLNLFTQEQVSVEIFQANVSPSGGLSFIGNEPMSLTFTGTLVTPSDQNGPYKITAHAAAA